MRFLVLAYSYQPFTNPRAIRWTALAEHWAASGYDVDVVCGWKPGLLRKQTLQGVRVHRVGGSLSERIRSRMRPQRDSGKMETAGPRPQSNRLIRKLAKTCHDLTWKKLYWPDAYCLWYAAALRASRQLLETRKYDALLSVSIPFTSHLVAHQLRKSLRGAAWLADVGDPFSFSSATPPNNTSIYHRTNVAWEGKVFRATDHISVTSDQTADRYRQMYPDCASKLVVIPPLVSDSIEPVAPGPHWKTTDRSIRLVFTGTLYRAIRNPQFLFDVFERLLRTPLGSRLELHLYGLVNDCRDLVERYQTRLGEHLHVHGPVSVKKSREAIADADVLINLGNRTECQLPSKIVEYAATGKPILNISSIAADSSAIFLKDYPALLTVCGNENDPTTAQIERLTHFLKSPPLVNRVSLEHWLARYRTGHVAQMYEQLIAPKEFPQRNTKKVRKAA